MLKVFVFLFSVIMLMQSSSKVVLVICYELNQKVITEKFCQNKNEPKLHCNGKCHLAKELNKSEKQEQSPGYPLKDVKEIVLFSESIGLKLPSINLESGERYFYYLLRPYSAYLQQLEHPPCS